MKITIATDTAADLLPKHIKENNIVQINLPVTFGSEEPCTSNELFWKNLLDGKVSHTSQPCQDELRKLFAETEQSGALIYVALSSKLSATYESAVHIKEALGCKNVYIVDSMTATFGEGLLALYACQLRDKGLQPSDIVEELEKLKPRIKVYACIDTLKYLERGGRISKTSATLGTFLNVKPLIEVKDGEVVPYGKTLGNRLASHKLTERLLSDNIDWDFAPVPIYAYDSRNCANFLEHANEKGLPFDISLITPIGPTIGTHIGPYAFGIVFVVKNQ